MTLLKFIGAATAFALLTQPAAAQTSAMDQAEAAAQQKTMIIAKVNGLVCDFCAQALTKVFKKEEAVETLEVDLDAGEVRIGLKAGQTLPDERVAKLIRKSGYSLVETTREGGA